MFSALDMSALQSNSTILNPSAFVLWLDSLLIKSILKCGLSVSALYNLACHILLFHVLFLMRIWKICVRAHACAHNGCKYLWEKFRKECLLPAWLEWSHYYPQGVRHKNCWYSIWKTPDTKARIISKENRTAWFLPTSQELVLQGQLSRTKHLVLKGMRCPCRCQ